MGNRKIISLAIISVLVGGILAMGAQLYWPKTGNTVAINPSSGTNSLSTFSGKIINAASLSAQTLQGTAVSDQGCDTDANGMSNCVSDIQTSQGTFAFNYQHNMNVQPCLAMMGPENVQLEILDAQGNAEVTRTGTVSGHNMGMS